MIYTVIGIAREMKLYIGLGVPRQENKIMRNVNQWTKEDLYPHKKARQPVPPPPPPGG